MTMPGLYDPVGLKVLKKERDAFLAPYLGRDPNPPTTEEIRQARSLGAWRDDEPVSHDDAISRILDAFSTISKREVAASFIVGLGRKMPALWSPISSWATALHLKPHEGRYPYPNFPCAECGLRRDIEGNPVAEIAWNNSVLTRHEYGGDCTLLSVLADLEDFPYRPLQSGPESSDIGELSRILDLLRSAPHDSTPGKLIKQLGRSAGRNEFQRTRLVEIFAIIGVLEPADNPSFLKAFTPYIDRPRPDGKNDWEYPAIWWRGTDGVSEEAVKYWFSEWL